MIIARDLRMSIGRSHNYIAGRRTAAQNQRGAARFRRAPAPTDVLVHRTGNLTAPAPRASAGDRVEKPPTIPSRLARSLEKSRLKDGCSQDWLPHKGPVFHGISRAEGPFKQAGRPIAHK